MNSVTLDDIDYNELTSTVEATSPEVIRSMRVYDSKGYYVTLRLSDLQGSEIVELEDEERGGMRRGIFIPFAEAGLTVTPKKNVLAVFKAEMAQIATSKYTHLLTQIVDRSVWEERRRLGFRTGFVGFMKPIGWGKKK